MHFSCSSRVIVNEITLGRFLRGHGCPKDRSSRPLIAASKAHMVEASPSLVEILRSTLARVEQSADLSPDDPAMVKLRRLVLRLIAELEVAKTRKAA